MENRKIQDSVLLGSWEDVSSLPLSTITKNDNDTEKLDGLILKGYETKFNTVNENLEEYSPTALDSFIQSYFIDHKLNMVLDIQHRDDLDYLAGRILYIEVNTVGYYIVAYIPRTYIHYEQVKNLIQEGILQGFSKMGFATDYEDIYNSDGTWSHCVIKEMQLMSISLVTMPANPIPFEKVQEIKNRLTFQPAAPQTETEPEPELKKNSVELLFS